MRISCHYIVGLCLLASVCVSAQSRWDDYGQVQTAIQQGQIQVPEDDNFKITVGQQIFTTSEVALDQSWVYYLIKWSLTSMQANTSFSLRDTLDEGLDGNTVTMLYSSNPYAISKNGDQIYLWNLMGLQIVENEDTKQGHVYFKVRIKPDAKPGIIRNTAFLDLQSGEIIQTTTAAIQIIGLASAGQVEIGAPRVFPNPVGTGQSFTLTHPLLTEHDEVFLFDAFGKSHSLLRSQEQCIAAQPLPSGVYQIVLHDAETGVRVVASVVVHER